MNPGGAGPNASGQPQSYIQMAFNFIKRVLDINRNSKHLQDGVVAMKVIITMLENLFGKIDEALPLIIQMVVQCLQECANEKTPPNYLSMLLQTLSMCFWYNTTLTFQILEQNQWTILVFQKWLQHMPTFKKDFELRRVIFGLTAIIKTPAAQLPQVVAQRLPDITKQLVLLSVKMRLERLQVLIDNEKHLAKGVEGNYEDASDDEGMSEDEGSEIDDDEYQKTLNKLQKARNQNEGKKGDEKEEEVEAEEEEDDEDDDDSDYEYAGGDLALYDSALDETDEIMFVRDAMQQITQVDMNYYLSLTSALSEEERNQFNEVMNGAQAFKDREEQVRIACEEMEKKK